MPGKSQSGLHTPPSVPSLSRCTLEELINGYVDLFFSFTVAYVPIEDTMSSSSIPHFLIMTHTTAPSRFLAVPSNPDELLV